MLVKGRVDKDLLLAVSAMSSHSQQDQAPRQTHLKHLFVAADGRKPPPEELSDVLDLKGHSCAYSAIVRCLDQINTFRETMDDENVSVVVRNLGGQSAWKVVKESDSVGDDVDRCLPRRPSVSNEESAAWELHRLIYQIWRERHSDRQNIFVESSNVYVKINIPLISLRRIILIRQLLTQLPVPEHRIVTTTTSVFVFQLFCFQVIAEDIILCKGKGTTWLISIV